MTDIEAKALALVNEVSDERAIPRWTTFYRKENGFVEALCRAIEQHEAFKQEVSDVAAMMLTEPNIKPSVQWALTKFIIPKPKPDPLVRVINEVIYAQPQGDISEVRMAKEIRAALEARGLEIREKSK